MTIHIIIGIIIAIIIIPVIIIYNNLVSEKLKVENQWRQIDIVFKERAIIIPQLISTIQGYIPHENKLIENVTNSRLKYLAAKNQSAAAISSQELSSSLSKLMTALALHSDLQNNTYFLDLQKQLLDMEERITNFRKTYNDSVAYYNRIILTTPICAIAWLFHFKKETFLDIKEDNS